MYLDAKCPGCGKSYREENRIAQLEEQLQQTQAEFAEGIVRENERLKEERDALVRYIKAHNKAVHWFGVSPSRQEFKDAKAECDIFWWEIPETTRKEIEGGGD